jgi:HPt (histidine-containing phosphotransfer) domain-containing protein
MPEERRSGGSTGAAANRTDWTSLEPPLDLVHLTRQCQGDAELENELLAMFRVQSRALFRQLSELSPSSLELKATIAHSLRGSALAVGAGRVASAAGAIEDAVRAARAHAPDAQQLEAMSQSIATLERAVAEAIVEVDLIRG